MSANKSTDADRQDDAAAPSYRFHGKLPSAFEHLREQPHWVAWGYRLKDGRWTKLPFNPRTGMLASVSTPATWGTFEAALACARKHNLAGVGLVLTADDGLTGIDLDSCITDGGCLTPLAADIIGFGETYAEISPSGAGLRLFASDKVAKALKNNTLGVEVYATGRYLTVTGNQYEGTPSEIRPAPNTLARLTSAVEAAKAEQTKKERGGNEKRESRANGEARRARGGDDFFRNVNYAALANLDAWVPGLLRDAVKQPGTGAWRVSSKDLGRGYQEDLSIHPNGIQDFGLEEAKSPIDLVIEHGGAPDVVKAALWLCDLMGVEPEELGWQDAVRSESGPQSSWEEPDQSILDDRRGDLPEFPIDLLAAEQTRKWLRNAARGAGVTVAHVVVPLLSIAAGLIGTARRVRASRSWSEPMSLWSAVVGFSGTGKTPGLEVTKRTLSMIQRNRKDKTAELQRKHEKKAETAKAAFKKWKREVEDAVDAGEPPPNMPPEAAATGGFVAPRLYATDGTIERLAVLLQARPSGLVMIYDELAGLFQNMNRYTGGSDKEFWLETFNGNHYVVERMGRALDLDHLLIAITGGFQPDKLARAFAGDDDGMYGRFLFAWPEEPEFTPLSNDVSEIEPAFQTALMRLIDLPAGEDDTFVPADVWLSEGALAEFELFRRYIHDGRDALDGREREWWAKGPAHVLRLAGTLCLFDWAMRDADPEPTEIAASFMQAAVQLWRAYFWPHARPALRQVGLSDHHANARRALHWLRVKRTVSTSREEIRRDALSKRLDAEQVQALIDGLVVAGWLREETKKPKGAGRPARRWAVNPKLLEGSGNAGNAGNAGNSGDGSSDG